MKCTAKAVTTKRAYEVGEGTRLVSLMDFGAKANIIASLVSAGYRVRVLPAGSSAREVLEGCPSGVLLSNGPGDPNDVDYAMPVISEIMSAKVPVMGICLGHQLLGITTGATAKKMKFGHRGSNHPVKDVDSGRCYITSQNHGYALDPEGLAGEWAITHYNLHDGTVEGMRHKQLPVFSVQFHPEAFPGPGDTAGLFLRFADLMDGRGNLYAQR